MAQSEPVIAYLVRHGPTAANDKGVFRGWRNYPLGDDGRQKAHEAAQFLKAKPTGELHSSDLSRAHETAEIIGRQVGKTPKTTMELRPWNIGDFAGKDKDKYQSKLDEYRKSPSVKIPGGEALNTFRDRFRGWFVPFIEKAYKAGKPPVAVTSASDIHEAANILHGDLARGEILPGGIAAVVHGDKGPALKILTGHNTSKQKSVS